MSDNPLADVADRFTADLVDLYGAKAGTSIAYLPGGIPVPDYFVQNGIVNVAQVSEWLHGTFDAPLLVDGPGGVAVNIQPPGYGSAMYERAVLGAQPIGAPDSDVRSQVNGLIASARAHFGAPDAAKIIECLPQDWPATGNDDYWASFDSRVETTTSTTTTVNGTPPTPTTVPIRINPTLWQLREVAPTVAEAAPTEPPVREGPVRFDQVRLRALSMEEPAQLRPQANAVAVSPGLMARSARVAAPMLMKRSDLSESPAFTRIDRSGVFSDDEPVQRFRQLDPIGIYGRGRVVKEVTTTATSSSLVVTLSHTWVSLTRAFGGVTWWDDIFLRDQRWYLPGEPSGALLPPAVPLADDTSGDGTGDITGASASAPAAAPAAARSYAIPVGLVLVRDLAVTGSWSNDASTVLASSTGLLGPFNLAGAQVSQSADGQSTYARPGMQVVAVFYASLPVLPPSPDPQLVPPAGNADTDPDGPPADPVPDGPVADDPVSDVPVSDDPVSDDPVSDDPVPAAAAMTS